LLLDKYAANYGRFAFKPAEAEHVADIFEAGRAKGASVSMFSRYESASNLARQGSSGSVEWHLVTGEYPPQPGGVGDYTYLLAKALSEAGERVHVWTPASTSEIPELPGVEIHLLPRNFGLAWLRALDQGLANAAPQSKILIQYVPHMYGWKSMNIAFCAWLALRRNRNFWLMFHEVAFPFKDGQPWKHHFLAITHRLMAWTILRTAKKSFTSTEAYKDLLARLAPNVPVRLLRLFSNVPFANTRSFAHRTHSKVLDSAPLVGVFSSFGPKICAILENTLPALLAGSTFDVLLIGPGAGLIEGFLRKYPAFKGRLRTSGRVDAVDAAPYFYHCDVLLQLYPEGACPARGTLMAALASGVPVVTTAGPLTGSLLASSGALAFSDSHPEAIRETIDALLADKAAARSLGAAARRLYENHFDINVTLAMLDAGRLVTH